jgi:hypothetical protein
MFKLDNEYHVPQAAHRVHSPQSKPLGGTVRKLSQATRAATKAPTAEFAPAKPTPKGLAKPITSGKVTPAEGDDAWETF